MIKKGRMKAPVKPNQEQLMMGHLLEPIAAYWYQQKTGNTVYDDTYMYQHADHPWALADFDRRFTRKEDNAASNRIRNGALRPMGAALQPSLVGHTCGVAENNRSGHQ